MEAFLAFLTFTGRSPNTVRAYAHDLRDFFAYLRGRELRWDELTAEHLAQFVVWLQMPAEGRAGTVAVLRAVKSPVSPSTMNRKLAAASTYYEFHAGHGVDVGDRLWATRHGRRLGTWKSLLAHLGPRPTRRRVISLKVD